MTASNAWLLVFLASTFGVYLKLRAPVGIDCNEAVPTERQAGYLYDFVSAILLAPVFLFWGLFIAGR